jgi:hypothetical protein
MAWCLVKQRHKLPEIVICSSKYGGQEVNMGKPGREPPTSSIKAKHPPY